MKEDSHTSGHIAALFTVIIWGSTFVSTKVLLVDFTPVEILFFRFSLGFLLLLIVYPHRMKATGFKKELTFAAAGLCGVTLYFLFENIALQYTFAANASVIVSIAPFITAVLSYIFLKGEKPKKYFFIGFAFAIIGIFLIAFNGSFVVKLNPIGDLLAMFAAFVWACYSVIVRKISTWGYHTIQVTRRIFFYGLLFILPTMLFLPFEFNLARFANGVNLFNILFLGFGASAICFVTWNFAVKKLGAVKTSVYIYLAPVVTIITSLVILDEKLTYISAIGVALTLVGLFISEKKN